MTAEEGEVQDEGAAMEPWQWRRFRAVHQPPEPHRDAGGTAVTGTFQNILEPGGEVPMESPTSTGPGGRNPEQQARAVMKTPRCEELSSRDRI